MDDDEIATIIEGAKSVVRAYDAIGPQCWERKLAESLLGVYGRLEEAERGRDAANERYQRVESAYSLHVSDALTKINRAIELQVAATTERDSLVAALRKYGRHDIDCIAHVRLKACDCGLAAVLDSEVGEPESTTPAEAMRDGVRDVIRRYDRYTVDWEDAREELWAVIGLSGDERNADVADLSPHQNHGPPPEVGVQPPNEHASEER